MFNLHLELADLLRVKLRYLDTENQRRQEIAARYDKLLIGAGIIPPSATSEVFHAYHQYVIQTPRRDELRKALQQQGIETAVHYPVPVHHQAAYHGRVAILGSLDVTEHIAPLILSLPIFPELNDEEVDRVASLILEKRHK
jgi:dTDP-4-amino-4,6-dideoxygalactose transaminase